MSHFTKLDLPTYFNLLDDLNRLVDWDHYGQICLNAPPGHEHDHQYGQGSLVLDWDRSYQVWDDEQKTNRWVVPKREIPLREADFTETVTIFRNTVFEQLLADLCRRYDVGRVRIMKLAPKTCLTWHVDDTNRIHYPFLTNPGCKMIIEDQVRHLDADTWWHTETTNGHTAINASTEPRLHVVAVLL